MRITKAFLAHTMLLTAVPSMQSISINNHVCRAGRALQWRVFSQEGVHMLPPQPVTDIDTSTACNPSHSTTLRAAGRAI
eukprot:367516-Pelagomonas_calceolata.AAC.2